MNPLTPYEAEQVRRIAGWKAEHPSYISAAVEKLTLPLVRLAERILPENAVRESIEDAYTSSEVTAHHEKVLQKAGVSSLDELRRGELARCDELAADFSLKAEEASMFWGAGAGGGTPLSALISVRALMSHFLKTIHTVGACYGFGTTEPHERDYVLGIMLIFSASTLEEKQNAIVRIGKVEDMIFEEALEDLLQDTLAEQLFSEGSLSAIPTIGILAGAVESARLTQQVAVISRYTFQERWLRDKDKVRRIVPSRKYARSLTLRVADQVSSGIYWTGFATTFLLSVPTVLLLGWIPRDHALGHGLADGSQDANQDVEEVLSKIKGKLVKRASPPDIEEAEALAAG
jgi:hypothetical protein